MSGFVTRKEIKEKLDGGDKFFLVDTRTRDSYEEVHIEGAVSLPLGEVEEKAKEMFDKEDEIIVYCGSCDCTASPKAVEKLKEMGFTKVFGYECGLEDWLEGDLPIITTKPEYRRFF